MRRIIKVVILIGIALYILSGVYVVKPYEMGVVRRFGKVIDDRVGPGLHYRFPFPIDRVDRPNVTGIRSMSIGYKLEDSVLGIRPLPEETQFLSGDENIINIRMLIQYTVKEPGAFLFNFVEPRWMVRREGEAALTRIVGATEVEGVFTTEKHAVQDAV
ncbi:unnamed protein product, partial [marine sediment metagenome]